MFLSRFYKVSGGCEKIMAVSRSFWSSLKFVRMMFLSFVLVNCLLGEGMDSESKDANKEKYTVIFQNLQ